MKIQPFQLERYFAQYEFSAPYLLSPSDCEPFTLAELLPLADPNTRRLWDDLWLGYTESRGLPALRAEAATLYEHITADDLLILTPEEGIFIAMNVLLKPGDHVVATFPGYQSLYQIAESMGCTVSRWMPREDNGQQRFDIDELETLLREDTRLVVINFPHNPTGALPSQEEYRRLLALAEARGLYVFSDEMYRFMEYDPRNRLPSACDLYPNAVSLFGVSKSFALPGLRIGWLATQNTDLMTQLANFKDYTTICSSAPSEVLALMALRSREQVFQRNLSIIRANLDVLDAFFARHAETFRWARPKAGTIAFPRYRGSQGVDAFCADLVERKGVMLVPASVFDLPEQNFRLGFGRRNLPKALAQLEEYLSAL